MASLTVVSGKTRVYEKCTVPEYNLDLTVGCPLILTGGRCLYCYGKLYNKPRKQGRVKVKDVTVRFLKQLNDIEPVYKNRLYIRIGKFTEPGHKMSEKQLLVVLHLLQTRGIRPIITTKLLKFSRNIAKIVKKLHGTIQFSFGYNELEPGAVNYGMSNKERLQHAKRYLAFGINVVFRIAIDVTQGKSHLDRYMKYILKIYPKRVLLTPLRFQNKDILNNLNFKINLNNYKWFRGYYRPNFIHGDYKNLPTCGDLSDGTEFCAKCLVDLAEDGGDK